VTSTFVAANVPGGVESVDARRYVWLVEPCDYDSFVTGVFSTAEAAIADIKSPYGAPYIVRWHPDRWDSEDEVFVSADFEQVVGFSTRHTGSWTVKRWEVQ
jgi:hypothetical protein